MLFKHFLIFWWHFKNLSGPLRNRTVPKSLQRILAILGTWQPILCHFYPKGHSYRRVQFLRRACRLHQVIEFLPSKSPDSCLPILFTVSKGVIDAFVRVITAARSIDVTQLFLLLARSLTCVWMRSIRDSNSFLHRDKVEGYPYPNRPYVEPPGFDPGSWAFQAHAFARLA